MSDRENPATTFIAHTLAHRFLAEWHEMNSEQKAYWYGVASDLVIAMYAAGFIIPQPDNVDEIWNDLKAGHL